MRTLAFFFCEVGLLLAQVTQEYGGRLIDLGVNNLGTASGTNTYTVTPSPALATYGFGTCYAVTFTNANTGAATLAVNSLTTLSIVKQNGTALASGDIGNVSTHQLCYNGTNLAIDHVDNAPTGGISGPGTTTANYVPQWNNATGTQLAAGLPVATSSAVNSLVEIGSGGTIDPSLIPSLNYVSSTTSQSANTVLAGPTTGTAAAPSFRALVSADVPNNAANTSGNAATATALASTPNQCSGGQFATGIAASGNANCSTPAGGGGVVHAGGNFGTGGSVLSGTHTSCFTLNEGMSVASARAYDNTDNGSTSGSATVKIYYAAWSPSQAPSNVISSGTLLTTITITSANGAQVTGIGGTIPTGSEVCGQISSVTNFTALGFEMSSN